MPNWCHNKLAITGEQDAVVAFIQKVQVTEGEEMTALTFTAHVPVPPGDDYDWFTWSEENWGTKWDANTTGGVLWAIGGDHASLDGIPSAWAVLDGVATIDFETAWGPPIAWLVKVSELEPHLRFAMRYAEAGNDFAGEVTAQAGEFTDETLPVEDVLAPEEMWF